MPKFEIKAQNRSECMPADERSGNGGHQTWSQAIAFPDQVGDVETRRSTMATSPEHHKESFTRRALKLHKPVLSLDRNTSGSPKHASHPSVFARFQAHFLPHSSSPPAAATTVTPGNVGPPPEIPEPDYVKIRIVTWNMNETLPKGDLAPLLGEVPAYQKNSNEKPDLKIPDLSLADDHPYHFVLIAGQECPTLMGLPLGLGGGLKWDRDEDEKKKDHKDKDEGKKRTDIVVEKTNISRPDLPSGSRTPSRYHHTTHHAVGWTSILEDYFSRGIGSIRGVKPDIFSPSTNPSAASLLASPDRPKPTNSPAGALVPGMANKGAKWKLPPGETDIPKIGPYELLTKERVMGIYLALYVHRDVQSLVEDYSQSSVTAGLMGGRLGNKGAVAISLKFAGTTFLFMNAHLAAHEEKVALRISNMLKIKSELVINDFLPPTDSRKLAEDPTDRFDHTFLCGDLNFRLDITRQHAEWLVNKQKDYAQAQHFDQLRKIMQGKGTNVFSGFSEAHIDFPPTFKYDILRTLKDRKKARREAKLKQRGLSEVREQDKEGSSTPSSTRIGETNDQDNSPIALSKSSTPSTAGFPAPLSGDSTKSGISERRTTSPSIGRTTPLTGGIGSLKLYGKRGSSLSATLPRSTVAAEALAQGLPASASSPPASNLEGSAPHKPGESRPPVPALRRILSLFSDSFSMASSPPPVATPEPVLPVYGPAPKIYKRGEVRCLSYSTLSDREMRRLEARSDHRPVIGRFAVYV
ncbi:hypothetical protein FRC14_007075 [Serendipita sp. 396]|nr:hypothetical protein FRC14_007075 [Serendipita sp. 396]